MAKIIGTVKNGFILEIGQDELAQLLGYYSPSSYDGKYDKGCARKDPEIGDAINIAAMYSHLRELTSASTEIRQLAAKLRASADLIDTLPEPLTAAKCQPDQKPEVVF